MIGGCITGSKYNMTATRYTKSTYQDPNTGQVKSRYTLDDTFALQARGLTNLRGKDSGTGINFRNTLDVYHFLRIKTQEKLDIGDIISNIKDGDGIPYLLNGQPARPVQFIVQGVTPTFDPFDSFMEYDVLADISETFVNLPGDIYTNDLGKLTSVETSEVVVL